MPACATTATTAAAAPAPSPRTQSGGIVLQRDRRDRQREQQAGQDEREAADERAGVPATRLAQ